MSEPSIRHEREFNRLSASLKVRMAEADLTEHRNILNIKKDLYAAEKCLKQMEIEAAMLPEPPKSQPVKEYRSDWQQLMDTLKVHEKQFYEKKNQETLMGSSLHSERVPPKEGLITIDCSTSSLELRNSTFEDSRKHIQAAESALTELKRRVLTNKLMAAGSVFLLLVVCTVLVISLTGA